MIFLFHLYVNSTKSNEYTIIQFFKQTNSIMTMQLKIIIINQYVIIINQFNDDHQPV